MLSPEKGVCIHVCGMIGSPEHSGARVVGLRLPEQVSKELLGSSKDRLADHLKSNDSRWLIKGPLHATAHHTMNIGMKTLSLSWSYLSIPTCRLTVPTAESRCALQQTIV